MSYADYCDRNCATCSSDTVCAKCEKDLHRELKDGKCVCEGGFKENGRYLCESTNEYVNYILMVLCIIFILTFLRQVLRLHRTNPLMFCNMLIFGHAPLKNDEYERKLVPLNTEMQLKSQANMIVMITDNKNENFKKQISIKSTAKKEEITDEENQKRMVQDISEFIKPESPQNEPVSRKEGISDNDEEENSDDISWDDEGDAEKSDIQIESDQDDDFNSKNNSPKENIKQNINQKEEKVLGADDSDEDDFEQKNNKIETKNTIKNNNSIQNSEREENKEQDSERSSKRECSPKRIAQFDQTINAFGETNFGFKNKQQNTIKNDDEDEDWDEQDKGSDNENKNQNNEKLVSNNFFTDNTLRDSQQQSSIKLVEQKIDKFDDSDDDF